MNLPQYTIFANEWFTLGAFFITIMVFIAFSEFLNSRFNWATEHSRKLVHVFVGVMISISPFLFESPMMPIILAVIFLVINLLALKSNLFQGMHATERKTYGTVYFPLAFLILAVFSWSRPVTLMAGTLLMTFADTIASIVGNNVVSPRRYRLWSDSKSLEGSTAMFVSSFLIIIGLTIVLKNYIPEILTISHIFGLAGIVAIVASCAESNSKDGSDNFSVPILSAITFDLYLLNMSNGSLSGFLIWILVSFVLLWGAFHFKTLSGSGAVSAFIIGILIFGAGGIKWITPLIIFFVFSSILSLITKSKSKALKNLTWHNYQKGSRRDLLQVLANGGVATSLAVINFYYPADWIYLMYLGAVAAATADTWATEIGFFSSVKPRHIITFKPVDKGTSGGVSIIGTAGTIAGAALIGISGYMFGIELRMIYLVILAGVAGSLIDSVLGGTVQSRFRCQTCGTISENHTHCDQPTQFEHGIIWIDNDMVNLLCTISGAIIVVNL